MVEEKEEKKKKNPKLYDVDVAEMADVYAQLIKCLEEAQVSIMPTPDALEAMVVSLCINRENQKRADARNAQENKPVSKPVSAPTNTSAGSQSGTLPNEKECPTCHAVLMRKFPKDGRPSRGFFSCGKCGHYVNEDGSTKAWK